MQDFEEMTDEEIEKIRTTVVIKTYSSLIKKHRYATPEQVQLQLKAVSKFGRALFNNIRGPNTHRRAPCGAPSLHDASASVASPNPLPYVLPLPLFPSSLTSPPPPSRYPLLSKEPHHPQGPPAVLQRRQTWAQRGQESVVPLLRQPFCPHHP